MSLGDWYSSKAYSAVGIGSAVYVKTIRERYFKLNVNALTKIVPWFFALDHKLCPTDPCSFER